MKNNQIVYIRIQVVLRFQKSKEKDNYRLNKNPLN